MEFPRLVYKSPTKHQLVEDQEQFDAALADGWFGSVPDAIEGQGKTLQPETIAAKLNEQADSTKAPTREELEQKATELGIEFKPQTSNKKLAETIAAKLAA